MNIDCVCACAICRTYVPEATGGAVADHCSRTIKRDPNRESTIWTATRCHSHGNGVDCVGWNLGSHRSRTCPHSNHRPDRQEHSQHQRQSPANHRHSSLINPNVALATQRHTAGRVKGQTAPIGRTEAAHNRLGEWPRLAVRVRQDGSLCARVGCG